MKFIVQKRKYYQNYTESELFVPELNKDIWVLEDIVRPAGIKFPGETCIPECIMRVSISHSTRFKREMMLLSNQSDFSVEKAGVRFTGIRPHGGNKIDDTHGCPLCNYHTDHKGSQWGRASDEIIKVVKQWLADGEDVFWIITS